MSISLVHHGRKWESKRAQRLKKSTLILLSAVQSQIKATLSSIKFVFSLLLVCIVLVQYSWCERKTQFACLFFMFMILLFSVFISLCMFVFYSSTYSAAANQFMMYSLFIIYMYSMEISISAPNLDIMQRHCHGG